jgi:ribosomal protein S18 acetylase RimI-like enzyme
MTTINYRPFRADDAPAVAALALTAWQATYRDIFTPGFIEDFVRRNYAPDQLAALAPRVEAGDMFFHVAVDQATIVGFCHIGLAEDAAILYRIYLHPASIGRGIGGRLLQLGEAFVRTHGLPTLCCFVHNANELGKRFYLRHAFRHRPEHDQDDEWFMEKGLR